MRVLFLPHLRGPGFSQVTAQGRSCGPRQPERQAEPPLQWQHSLTFWKEPL